ncbi:hypothetical protein KAR91_23455 [Candidatus Pacearchaeota archaeon]|nr:hypothetical protein [Candidatus Pacearchaeota archaeon]
MSLKLLKIAAIMKQFNCMREEAEAVKRTGIAPAPKKVAPVVTVALKKKVTKVDMNDKEAN